MYNVAIRHVEYWRLGGLFGAADPNREIGFGFVSCSCRACVRACVRSCVGAWGMCSSTLEARTERNAPPAGGAPFDRLLLYAWVLRYLYRESYYVHGFFDRCWDIQAICMGFKLLNCFFGRSLCYMHGFFDQFRDLYAIRMGFKLFSFFFSFSFSFSFSLNCFFGRSLCYMHGFFD